MKRLCKILLVSLLFLSGCTSDNTNELGSKKLDEYKSNVEQLKTSKPTKSTSEYFTVSYEMSTLPDGTHRYYIIVDNATQSMYDVRMMALDVDSDTSTTMAPSIGILDDENYNLVPSQVAVEDGFVKGLVLSGDTTKDAISVKLMVSWNDEVGLNSQKEFLLLHIEANQNIGE